MFGKNQKRQFNNHTVAFMILVCLLFVSISFNIDNSYAMDVNENNETIITDLIVENQIGTYQNVENDDVNLKESNVDNLTTIKNEVKLSCQSDKKHSGEILSSNDDKIILKAENSPEEILSETAMLGGYFSGFEYIMQNFGRGHEILICDDMKYREEDHQQCLNNGLILYTNRMLILDADHQMSIFRIEEGADGLKLTGFKLINAIGTTASAMDIYSGNILIEDCNFENNHCLYGGVVTIHENVNNVTFRNCNFTNNSAYYDDFSGKVFAGAVSIFGSNCTFEDCIFDSNWVLGNEEAYAGAMLIGQDVEGLVLKNCVFKNNYAINNNSISQGGAVMINNLYNFTNCTFINNTASQGGAIMFNCSGNVSDCNFINNTAHEIGGAIFTNYGDLTLYVNNTNFEGNTAQYGGALFIINENLIIENSNFISNHAEINGGALFVNAVNYTILNSNFTSNVAENYGGSVYINSSKTTIKSSKFTSNKATNGSAIYLDKNAKKIVLTNIECYSNKALGYLLSVASENIYFPEIERINMTVIDGDNINDYNDILISNGIYSACENSEIEINGKNPVDGVTMNGLYRDELGYNVEILLTLTHEDNSIAYNQTALSSYLGQSYVDISNLRPGKYNLVVKPSENSTCHSIENTTSFEVYPKVDAKITLYSNSTEYKYADVIIWSLNITNIGLNDAYNLTVNFTLPEGLSYISDDSEGLYDFESGILNISRLNKDESVIYNITTKINRIGLFNIKMNITTIELDTNLTNNLDEFTFNVDSSSDLAIYLSSNDTDFNYHDLVNWTITVKNNGPSTAHDINISEVFGNELIIVDFAGNYDLNNFSWNIPSLDVGEEIILNLITKINATGEIINTVNVKAFEYDFNKSNNEISSSINVYPTSDLSINLTLNSTNINYLDLLTLTLTIINNGLDNATNVKVTNILPRGFTYLNSSLDYVNNEFEIGNLSVGEVVLIDINCKMDITGTFNNCANISGDEFDYDVSNNLCISEIFINPSSELSIIQSVSDINPNFYDLVNWTITVKNNGPDIAHNVTVCDLLSDSLIYICDDSNNDYNDATGEWFIESINPDESTTLIITSRVINSGVIANNINVSGCEYDYNLLNNQDSISIYVNVSSDLKITLTVNETRLNYHDLVKWNITIKNNGVDKANNVKVFNVIPEGITYINSTLEYWHNTFDVGTLSVGEEKTIEVYCKVDATGEFINHVNITCDEYDYNLSNNKNSETIFVYSSSDLEISHSISSIKANYLDLINLTIFIKNNGPDIAQNVSVYDLLPECLIYQSDDSLNKYNPVSGLWSVGDMGIGASDSLTIYAKVNKTGLFFNNINITSNYYDYYLNNNNDTLQLDIPQASDLTVIFSLNASEINYGDIVKLTITVENNGIDNATAIRLTNTLPEGLIYIDSILSFTNGVFYIDKLAVGEKTSIEIYLKANKSGNYTDYINIVADEYDFNLEDNNISNTIIVKPACDLQINSTFNAVNLNYGDYVEFTITVKNNALDMAHDVVVYNLISNDLIYVDDTSDGDYDRFTGIWNIKALNVGDEINLTITYKINKTGLINHHVNVSSLIYDYDIGNNYNLSIINVNNNIDLAIVSSINASNVNYGDLIKLTLTITNYGVDNVEDIEIKNIIPNEFVIIDSTLNTIDKLSSGETKEVYIILKVNGTGEFNISSDISSNLNDFNLENNNHTISISVASVVDLVISQDVLKANYKDCTNILIFVKNNGPDIAQNVRVYDILPDSLSYIADDSNNEFNHLTGIWAVGNLNAGESKVLNISCSVEKTGLFVNVVNVTSDIDDYNLENNNCSIYQNISSSVDLIIKTEANVSFVNYLDLIKLTLTLENNGSDVATNIKLVNTLPNGLIYTESFLNSTNGVFFIEKLLPNQKISFDIILKAIKDGNYLNNVSVISNEYDYNLENNNDSIPINVNPASDLEIISMFDISNAKYGDLIKLTIKITNNGPNLAENVCVTNLSTSSLIYQNDDSNGDYNHLTGIWDVETLSTGENQNLTIIFKVNNTGILTNNVKINSSQYDYNKLNNNCSSEIFIEKTSDLSITAQFNQTSINYLDLIKLTIIAKNNGIDNAENVKIKTNIFEGLELINSTVEHIDNTLTIKNLNSNEEFSINMIFKVKEVFNYLVNLNISCDEFDYNMSNNEENVSINVNPASDLEIYQNVSNIQPNYLDLISLTISVKNNGPNEVYDIKVCDLLSDLLIYDDCDSNSNYDSQTGLWNINYLAVGDTKTLTIQCKVNKTGNIFNNVNVTSNNYDYDLSNNNDSLAIDVGPACDLLVSGSFNQDDVNFGDLVILTLTVVNNGVDDASDVLINVSVPYGFVPLNSTLISMSSLVKGESVVCDLTFRVNVTGEHLFGVNVSCNEYDYNLSNNNMSLLVDVNDTSDLEVIAVVNDLNPNYGDYITLNITVKNKGLDDAYNVIVRNVLCDSLIYVNGNYNLENNSWIISTLSVGESKNLTVKCKVNKTGVIYNNLDVVSNNYDYDLSNNNASLAFDVGSACDLLISGRFNQNNVNFGDLVILTLTVVNNGVDDASDVLINVSVSDGFVPLNSTLISMSSLVKGESVVCDLTFRVNVTGVHFFGVNVSCNEYDYNLSNNNMSLLVNVNATSDLEVIVFANESYPDYQEHINLTVTVKNNGLDDAHNIIVTNIIPESLIYISDEFDEYDLTSNQWFIPIIEKGNNRLLSIVCEVNKTGVISNTINVSSDEFDFNLNNNNASFLINVTSAVELSINGGFNVSTLNYGDLAKLTLTITNMGLNDASGVIVEIEIPEELIFINSSLKLDDDVINIGNLACGDTKIIEMIFKTDSTGNYSISSNIESNELDYNSQNNHNIASLLVNPESDLSITSTVNTTNINYLDLVKLSLTITNTGLDSATNITINNILSKNFIFINSTLKYENDTIILENLDSGQSIVADIIYQANKSGNYSILSNVSASEYDINLENNDDVSYIYVNPASDLEVINIVNDSNLKYGDLVNWTVVIKNNGPDEAHNILIQDLIPDTLSKVNLIGNINLNSGEGVIDYLNVGEEIQFNIVAIIDSTGLIENVVSVNGVEYDYNTSNNQNTGIININPACDLMIACSVNTTQANYQDLVKWTITITNAGPDNATNVKIENKLPNGFIFINSTLNSNDGVFNIDCIENGEIINIDIITKVNATGNFTNNVNITTDIQDIYSDNNYASASITISPACDLEIIKTSNATSSNYGDLINWTINVKNKGIDVADNVVVIDLLPDYLIYVEDDSDNSYNPVNGMWDINSLDVNEEKTLNIITKVNKMDIVVNEVNVSSTVFDYNLNNNYHHAIVNIDETVDVSVNLSVNNTNPFYGDLVKWTISVSNNALINATDVEVQNILPDGLIIINYTSTKGIYNNSIWNIGSLENNQIETLELITKLNKLGGIANNALIKANEYDINKTNNEAKLEIYASKSIGIQINQNITNLNPYFGEDITLIITVANNGLNNISDVKLVNNLSDSLTILNIISSKGEYVNGTWDIGFIESGNIEYLNITCNINQSGLITNYVEISSLKDNLTLNNTFKFNATSIVDVYIEEVVNNTNPTIGDFVKITVTVSNKGLNKATNVEIQKILPDGLTLINTTITKGTYSEDTWFECCLENGENQTLEMICKVNKVGLITHNVTVTSQEEDINLTNNYANVSINVSEIINVTSNNESDNFSVNKKVVDKVKISVKKLTNIKKSNKVSKIKITLKGSKITAKKNIKFRFNGKNKVNIKVAKALKNKKVTVNFKNTTYKVKVNKKSLITLKLSKKVSKKLIKGKAYSGILSWKIYKVYKNKKLTIKFNAKKYTVKTNKKGVAIFKVTNKMLKNFKKGKKVKYTVSYQNEKVNRFIKIK